MPTTEAVLGREELLGLKLHTVIPELVMATDNLALSELLPKHEASMARAHRRAREPAATVARAGRPEVQVGPILPGLLLPSRPCSEAADASFKALPQAPADSATSPTHGAPP